MSVSATALANSLIEADESDLETLRIHEFADDAAAHDDEAIKSLYADFVTAFDEAVFELSVQYGEPSRTGDIDEPLVPLNGVFRFALWTVEGKQLFVTAAHEDRGFPIVLMLGTAANDTI